jgi:carbon monoxide dehydrogenase subunit G
MQIVDSITVGAPIGATFGTFSDIEEAAPHLSGITKLEVLEGTSPGVGFKWRETRSMFGREATEEMWMTEFEAPSRYAVEAESHGSKYRTTFEFTSVDESTTEVQMTFSGTAVSMGAKVMSFLSGFMTGSVKKAFHQDLVDMKDLAESKTEAP